MSKIIKEYNTWKEGKTEKNQTVFKKEPLKVKTSLLVGFANTSLKTNRSEENYSPSTSFSGGVSFSLILPRSKEKWMFNNELQYHDYNAKSALKTGFDKENYTVYSCVFRLKYIKINSMVPLIVGKEK